MRRYFVLFGLVLGCFGAALAGNQNYTLSFRAVKFDPEVTVNFSEAGPSNQEVYNGKYYRIIQFYSIPSNEEKEALEDKGVTFIYYQPYNAYYISLPQAFDLNTFSNANVRSLFAMDASWSLITI